MSAGTQLQMAPQTTVVQGGQQTTGHSNQDSNMSTGSSHSDKEVESAGTPDKISRTTSSERKRKRKALDDNSGGERGGSDRSCSNNGGTGGLSAGSLGTNNTIQQNLHNSSKTRLVLPTLPENKKINDYFKHTGTSPVRQTQSNSGGAKSPSSQHGFPMYAPTTPSQMTVIGGPGSVGAPDFFKNRNTSNIISSAQSMQQQLGQCQLPPQQASAAAAAAKVSTATQTELSFLEIEERDCDFELSKTKVDELSRLSDEQKVQITAHQKTIDQHKNHINKCIDVVKKLLMEKSNIEKKEARQKCMQNRLRLGQFVTQRVGATFQENWTDGYAFQELARRQEEIAAEREEIDRQKKILMKKRPTNQETGRKRNNSTTTQQAQQQQQQSNNQSTAQSGSGTTNNLHNGSDATFLKPDPVSGSYTMQEYYECDEILKLRQNTLKKEDADLQLETEKLERERNLHIRELKRIHNEDQVSVCGSLRLYYCIFRCICPSPVPCRNRN